ncbi:MAG: tRNA pseudouridine synthase A, partial [Desulfomonilaceae bacterium]
MPKFKAIIEYDGTNYCGWQLQPNVPTVQGEIEQALEKIFLQRIPVYGAGRTDAGVHAQGQVIHLVPPWRHPAQNLLRALNSLLPPDVAIKEIGQVDDNFHARHSAVSKTYRYRILNREIRSPLKRLY